MKTASISELKNHLSSYLKSVTAGETVLIMDRNRPVARLERVRADEDPANRLGELERKAFIRRAICPVPLDRLREPPPVSAESVVAALLDERAQGR